ncbi:MAG: hypothetical protein JO290_01365 [Sphingomonadaceae bacterium]|nr:hypothetical protein [Sphingomonadaceae bacterium]
MTFRPPLVFGSDGLLQQVQSGDGLQASGAEWLASIPAAPNAGAVREGVRTWGGRDMLAVRSAQWPEQVLQSLIGRDRVIGWIGRAGAGNLDTLPGTYTPTIVGSLTGRSPATSSLATRAGRVGIVSSATAGSAAAMYGGTSAWRWVAVGDGAGNGGFHFVARFVPSDAAAVSGAQMFLGVAASNSAPTTGDPSANVNQIGVGGVAGSSNLQVFAAGGTAQSAIDLGSNFPANSLAVDLYEVHLFSSPFDNTKIAYQVDRNGGSTISGGFTATGTIANTTPGTTLPATSTVMMPRAYRTNNATALAVGIDISSLVVHTPY